MLQPARTKFRKAHKGRIKGFATSANNLDFGALAGNGRKADRRSNQLVRRPAEELLGSGVRKTNDPLERCHYDSVHHALDDRAQGRRWPSPLLLRDAPTLLGAAVQVGGGPACRTLWFEAFGEIRG